MGAVSGGYSRQRGRGLSYIDGLISRDTFNQAKITCDPAKRERTLQERGIDFVDAAEVFAGRTLTLMDDRIDYGEVRYQTYGFLGGRVVMVVWTNRAAGRHVISMRHCHEREAARVRARMG